jgi:hypothetical protein
MNEFESYSVRPIQPIETRISPESRDAAKRATDAINLHLLAQGWDAIKECWIAFKLEDGSSDGTLYDSKQDAARHQSFEQQYYYFSYRDCQVMVTERDIAIVMQFAREAYHAGLRFVDPDDKTGGPAALMTAARYDYLRAKLGL